MVGCASIFNGSIKKYIALIEWSIECTNINVERVKLNASYGNNVVPYDWIWKIYCCLILRIIFTISYGSNEMGDWNTFVNRKHSEGPVWMGLNYRISTRVFVGSFERLSFAMIEVQYIERTMGRLSNLTHGHRPLLSTTWNYKICLQF